MDGRVRFFLALVVLVCAFTGTAQAGPLFTQGADISPSGQAAFEPQVTVDPSGNPHAVWTRSDGTNLRIQYATRTPTGSWGTPINISDAGQSASQPQIDSDSSGNLLVVWTRSDGTNLRIQSTFKPSGGSFSAPINISDPGFDAAEPQIDFDSNGKAIAVWSRADGSNPGVCCGRVQASIRSAGVGGVFQNEVTVSKFGQDAFDAQIAAGPDADTNGVLVWTRSDGTNLRVQSARRKDFVAYVRPNSAPFARTPLTPAYNQCLSGSGNRVHGVPLAHESCNPPTRASVLTIGTSDANGQPSGSVSYVRWGAIQGNSATEANEADVQAIIRITDVRNDQPPGYADYAGQLGVRTNLQITDRGNQAEEPESGTSVTSVIEVPIQCVTTASTSIGGACNGTVSLNALLPGAVVEGRRSNWELGQTVVRDAGPNGTGYAACPPTCGDGDERVFMRQGLFVP